MRLLLTAWALLIGWVCFFLGIALVWVYGSVLMIVHFWVNDAEINPYDEAGEFYKYFWKNYRRKFMETSQRPARWSWSILRLMPDPE